MGKLQMFESSRFTASLFHCRPSSVYMQPQLDKLAHECPLKGVERPERRPSTVSYSSEVAPIVSLLFPSMHMSSLTAVHSASVFSKLSQFKH